MDVIQDEVSIRAVPNKFGFQSQKIKDLISRFESAQQDMISNKHKNMEENSNQYQIL